MIERAQPTGARLEPDDEAFAVIRRALVELAARAAGAPALPAWHRPATSWRFSGRSWASASHDPRDRPRR